MSKSPKNQIYKNPVLPQNNFRIKVFEDSQETFFEKVLEQTQGSTPIFPDYISKTGKSPKNQIYKNPISSQNNFRIKVFEDSQETFFKKFLERGTGQSPVYYYTITPA